HGQAPLGHVHVLPIGPLHLGQLVAALCSGLLGQPPFFAAGCRWASGFRPRRPACVSAKRPLAVVALRHLTRARAVSNADSRVRAGSEIVVLRCAREPATGVASLSHRGGTAWPILTAEARCWILTRTLRCSCQE